MTPAVPGDPGRHVPGSRAEGVSFARSEVAGLGRRLVAGCNDAPVGSFLVIGEVVPGQSADVPARAQGDARP